MPPTAPTTPSTSPSAPASSPVPSVKVPLGDGREINVEFTFSRLEAIESSTGKTVLQLAAEWGDMAKAFADAQAAPVGGTNQPAALMGIAGRISASTIGRFLAGCVGCTLEQLDGMIPLKSSLHTFMLILPAFYRAVGLLNGVDIEAVGAEAPPDPQAGSGVSAPGPVSSSH